MDAEEQVRALDRGVLTDVVRRLLHRAALTVTDWQSRSIFAPVVPTTVGVYRLTGHATDGAELVSWAVVLKIMRAPSRADAAVWGEDRTAASYWKRDVLMYQSGVLSDLPGGLAAPRCLLIAQQPGEVIWLWLEDIVDELPRWPLNRYRLAARHLGRFSGAFLGERPLPAYPWLSHDFLRRWSGYAATVLADPAHLREHPRVRQVWSGGLMERLLGLGTAREGILTTLDQLPQTLCHHDAGRRNLFARRRPDTSAETVAIDWGCAGNGALGEDLAPLVIAAALWFLDVEPAQLPDLAGLAFEGYVEGLRDAGWQGDTEVAYTGFVGAMALRYGLFPLVEAATEEEVAGIERAWGRPLDEVAERLAAIRRFVLDQVEGVTGLV